MRFSKSTPEGELWVEFSVSTKELSEMTRWQFGRMQEAFEMLAEVVENFEKTPA